ncbi:MAG: DUF4136 domain-containing protein [Pseudomonadota bacterium]
MAATSYPRKDMPARWAAALFALLLTGLLGACTAKPTGYSDFDIDTDFSGFKTFSFVPGNTLVVASPNPPNPALEPTLKEEVRKYLTNRGFRYTANEADADFVIGFAVGGTPTTRTTAFTNNYRQVRIAGQGLSNQVVNQESSEGGLVIDMFDQGSGDKKWMGWAIQEITMGDMVQLERTVRETVGVILQHFPPEV